MKTVVALVLASVTAVSAAAIGAPSSVAETPAYCVQHDDNTAQEALHDRLDVDPFQPADSLLRAADYLDYRKALDAGRCESARKLIKVRFAARYPHDACLFDSEADETRAVLMERLYPRLALCDASASLDASNERLSMLTEHYPAYPLTRDDYGAWVHEQFIYNTIRTRDTAIETIRFLCLSYDIPLAEACHFLVTVARDGDGLELNPREQSFLLLRSWLLGVRDADTAAWILDLDKNHDEADRRQIGLDVLSDDTDCWAPALELDCVE